MASETVDERVEKLLDRMMKMCPVPKAVQRVMSLCVRDDVEVRGVADAIAADPALAVETLRISNSAFYGRTREVDSLHEAVVTIGLTQVHAMASAFAVMSAFRSDHKLSRELQRNAVFAGSLAGLLSIDVGMIDKGTAFLAGLLSEVGALGCLSVDKAYADLWNEADGSWGRRAEMEQARYGLTSWEIGALLLERHELPELVYEAVGSHCESSEESLSDLARLTIFCRLAAPEIANAPDYENLKDLEGRLMDLAELAYLKNLTGGSLVGLAEWAAASATMMVQSGS